MLPSKNRQSALPSPSSLGASPSATCSPRSSSSSNRPCPCLPSLPPRDGATRVLNVPLLDGTLRCGGDHGSSLALGSAIGNSPTKAVQDRQRKHLPGRRTE